MNHTYKPPSLLPAAGQERTYALIIAGVPLLLILLTGVLPQLGSGSGGSTGTSVTGSGGYSYQPSLTDPAAPGISAPDISTPDISTTATSTTYGTDPQAPAPGTEATGLSPSPADTQATDSASGTPGAGDPASTVTRYFAAINNRDFHTAWDLGGKNLDSSYSSFVSGFEGTERDDVTVGTVDGTAVSVSLVAQQTDGTQKSYSGRYTVVDGVITAASITPAG
ncbi:hypothetical protein A6P39_017020 [Streptomyces sp. FXJ1.172]|uniref:hypothetical protein n=1 Tax=Streptomyces sp. FXJ1.172 TaxID=710705 RepID=UPI0007D02F32|nr:hypothetical protein [Streptomyces sp. FXJ1.172]WEO95587.1 hypothetical protein A6P39_017020 [Streptomyces sp. FXJ1.172]